MYARNKKIFIEHLKANHLWLHKNLSLNVPNKKQPKVCAAAYAYDDVLPIINELIHVFKQEFTLEIT